MQLRGPFAKPARGPPAFLSAICRQQPSSGGSRSVGNQPIRELVRVAVRRLVMLLVSPRSRPSTQREQPAVPVQLALRVRPVLLPAHHRRCLREGRRRRRRRQVPPQAPTRCLDAERSPVRSLPAEGFDPGVVLHLRVDRSAIVTVRMVKYSVPAHSATTAVVMDCTNSYRPARARSGRDSPRERRASKGIVHGNDWTQA